MSQNSGNLRLNGEEVPAAVVNVLMLSLEKLIINNPIAFRQLVMSCCDQEHVLQDNTGEALVELNLIEGIDNAGRARIHSVTRSIVRSITEGGEPDDM